MIRIWTIYSVITDRHNTVIKFIVEIRADVHIVGVLVEGVALAACDLDLAGVSFQVVGCHVRVLV